MKLISVIVPVYNVESFLNQCVESICKQTYPELEIILVDDGSTDRSGILCDEFAQKDSRIKVLHKENGGISSARNAGLAIASGDYIGFVDSDDFVDKKMYEKMLSLMDAPDVDLAICSYQSVDENGDFVIDNPSPVQNETVESYDMLKKLHEKGGWYYVTAWNRLYRRELFRTIRFPVNKKHEDTFVAHEIIMECKRVVTMKEALYYYRARSESIMAKADISRLDGVEAAYQRFRCYEQKGWRELLAGTFQVGRDHLEIMGRISDASPEGKKRRKEIIKMYRYMFLRAGGNRNLKNCIIAVFPNLYFKIKYAIKYAGKQ